MHVSSPPQKKIYQFSSWAMIDSWGRSGRKCDCIKMIKTLVIHCNWDVVTRDTNIISQNAVRIIISKGNSMFL